MRTDSAVVSLNFGIWRFDDEILVRSVRPTAVSEAPMSGRQPQRLARHPVPRPRPGLPRPGVRLNIQPLAQAGGPPNYGRFRRRVGRIETAGHVDLDVAEPALREVRL